MEKELKNKLEEIVTLVDKLMVDPDIDIEYCIPEVAVTADNCDLSKDPYILVQYFISEYHKPTRKIRLTKTYLRNSPEKISNLITSSIADFKTEIDSVEIS